MQQRRRHRRSRSRQRSRRRKRMRESRKRNRKRDRRSGNRGGQQARGVSESGSWSRHGAHSGRSNNRKKLGGGRHSRGRKKRDKARYGILKTGDLALKGLKGGRRSAQSSRRTDSGRRGRDNPRRGNSGNGTVRDWQTKDGGEDEVEQR